MAKAQAWLMARGRRLLKIVAGLGAAYLLMMLVLNVCLATGAFSGWVNQAQDKVQIRWESGFALYPGQFSLEDVDVAIREEQYRVHLHFDEVEANLALVELASQVLRFEQVRGDGVEIAVRIDPDYVAPGPEGGAGGTGSEEAAPAYWTLDFPHVETELRKLEIEEARLAGDLHVVGGFRWRIKRDLEIATSVVHLRTAELSFDGEVVESGIQGFVAARLPALAHEHIEPKGLLTGVAAHAAIQSSTPDLRAHNAFLTGAPFELVWGQATTTVAGGIDRGQVLPDSSVEVLLKDAGARLKRDSPYLAGFNGTIHGSVDADIGRTSILATGFSRLTEADAGDERYGATAELEITVWWNELIDFETPKAPNFDVSAVGRVDHELFLEPSKKKDGLRYEAGRNDFDIRLRADETESPPWSLRAGARGKSRLHWGSYTAAMQAWTQVEMAGPGVGRGGVSGRVELGIVDLAYAVDGEVEERGWQGHLLYPDVQLDPLAEGIVLRARGGMTGTNADPTIAVPPLDEAIPDVIVGLLDMESLRIEADLYVNRSGVVEIKLHRASTDSVDVRGRLLTNGETEVGAFLIDTPLKEVGVALGPDADGFELSPDDDWQAQHFAGLVEPADDESGPFF